jgi:predicted AlkP superfamily phosphohydrolase/phosphomutase
LLSLLAQNACRERTDAHSSAPTQSVQPGRVLVIGIDGASPRLMRELLDAGRLPNLGRLRAEGAFGNLHSEFPLFSPIVWTTIASGKGPAKHGIHGFEHVEQGEDARLSRSTDRTCHALWNIASDRGRSVAVVNWWVTFPPEKVNGVIVSEHVLGRALDREGNAASDAAPTGFAYPEAWEARLLALDDDPVPVPFADPFRGDPQLPDWVSLPHLSRWFEQDASVARYVLEIEASLKPDLAMVLFTGIDRVSHSLWSTVESPLKPLDHLRTSEAQQRAGARILRDYYVFSDALVGRLLEGYGPNDLVLVVSDHGFEAAHEPGQRSGEHHTANALDGVIFARGRGITAGSEVGDVSIRDLTPTVLAWWDWPGADDMDGRVAAFLSTSGDPGRVASYDATPIEYRIDPTGGADKNLAEQLRALGYLE